MAVGGGGGEAHHEPGLAEELQCAALELACHSAAHTTGRGGRPQGGATRGRRAKGLWPRPSGRLIAKFKIKMMASQLRRAANLLFLQSIVLNLVQEIPTIVRLSHRYDPNSRREREIEDIRYYKKLIDDRLKN